MSKIPFFLLLAFLSFGLILKTAEAATQSSEEEIDCMVGTEDNQARIAVYAVGGKVQSFAYYSKWKPRTCSVDAELGDAKSVWNSLQDAVSVTLEKGEVVIEQSADQYKFTFKNVDRTKYCGMSGKLNGSMIVKRGQTPECSVQDGLMDRDPVGDDSTDNFKPRRASDRQPDQVRAAPSSLPKKSKKGSGR